MNSLFSFCPTSSNTASSARTSPPGGWNVTCCFSSP